MSDLHASARAAGIQVEWRDASGRLRRVSDETARAVLDALDQEEAPARHPGLDPGAPCFAPDRGAGAPDRGQGEQERCVSVAALTGRPRVWGAAAQIYALRDDRDAAFGDFGTLARTAAALGRAGADALAINPTHALFPADASRFSPYAPSSRLHHNILYADPALIGAPAPPAPGPALIDWATAIPARLTALRAAWAGAGERVCDAVAAFRAERGETLERHARFDALHAHFFAATGATGWRDWPAAYHHPASEAVERFAVRHAAEIAFYAFAQWLADQGLAAAQRAARGAGMAIGLIADLAVGVDPGGSQAWSARDALLTGLSIGAPPDQFNPDGQGWGITGFSPAALKRTGCAPFAETLRAALRHAGGVRIDHALGLSRLWVIPDGAPPRDGAYLTMPLGDLLRIVATESARARAIVIGEDLGTVPPGLREAMAARGLLGMRVLQFERDGAGRFLPPDGYQTGVAAMTGTHDLPTIAGWWDAVDLDWARKLGRRPSATRDGDKQRLWDAFVRAGVASGPLPTTAAPAVTAALAFCAATPSTLVVAPLEDLAGLAEQPNIPGTTTEHPNWRRRLPLPTADLLAQPDVPPRLALPRAARPAAHTNEAGQPAPAPISPAPEQRE